MSRIQPYSYSLLINSPMRDDDTSLSIDDLPLEMNFKIISYLDFASVLNARLVSRTWKMMVGSSRNLSFCCHLTDESLLTVVSSSEHISSVKIHDFTGNGNSVVSSTRGTGRIFAKAESIHVIGNNVNAAEMDKMMKYAVRSVKELTFQICSRQTLIAIFHMKRSFTALRKLVIGYKSFPRRNHTIVLERLASLPRVALPSLQHFKISYGLDNVDELYTQKYIPTPREVFANYLAIAKIIARYGTTLDTVEIARNEVLRTALVLQVDTTQILLTPYESTEIQNCLEQFDHLNLVKLHITPVLDEGEYPWILETSLLRRQRNLQKVYLNKKLCSPRLGSQALETILPRNCSFFTSVKISLTCMGNAPVDLSPFAQCPNLKTLWLAFYRGVRIGPARQNSLHFTNLEMIPKTITSLHFKSSQQDTIIIHQQSILTREQLRWVIDNLVELESLWMQLVAEEPNEPVDPPQLQPALVAQQPPPPDVQNLQDVMLEEIVDLEYIPAAAPDGDEDREAQEARQLLNRLNEELNVNANVNVDTFRDLIYMPKIKDLKFDMLKAGQLGSILELGADGNPWILPMGIHVSLNDIREYIAICEEDPSLTYRTQTTSFFPFGFIELTVTKT